MCHTYTWFTVTWIASRLVSLRKNYRCSTTKVTATGNNTSHGYLPVRLINWVESTYRFFPRWILLFRRGRWSERIESNSFSTFRIELLDLLTPWFWWYTMLDVWMVIPELRRVHTVFFLVLEGENEPVTPNIGFPNTNEPRCDYNIFFLTKHKSQYTVI